MSYNISEIKSARQKIESALNKLSSALSSSDWDDEVKDSYKGYLSECKSAFEGIASAERSIESKCNELNGINVDSIINDALVTARQIQST